MNESTLTAIETTIRGEQKTFPLEPGKAYFIGRQEGNAVVLPDGLVSRRHAMLQLTDGGDLYLTDMGSANGTYVNGRRLVAPTQLRPGDRFTIGSFEFSCQQQDATPQTDRPPTGEVTKVHLTMRLVTVLVVDIRNFTGLSRLFGEGKVSEMITAFNRDSGHALMQRGTLAQKYGGDSVMAVWLHPKGQPAWRELADVFAGLQEMFLVADGLQERFGLETPIRIGGGLNTGFASLGNVGSSATADFTVLGDAVNKAFRLESVTKELKADVVVGQETYNLLSKVEGAGFLLRYHEVALKGYEEPQTAYGMSREELPRLVELLRAQG